MSTVPYQILRRPLLLTEKGNTLKSTLNQYVFEIARSATKTQVREALEKQFPGIRVLAVRTLNMRGHERRMGRGTALTRNWKKAIVTLREGDRIEYFDTY